MAGPKDLSKGMHNKVNRALFSIPNTGMKPLLLYCSINNTTSLTFRSFSHTSYILQRCYHLRTHHQNYLHLFISDFVSTSVHTVHVCSQTVSVVEQLIIHPHARFKLCDSKKIHLHSTIVANAHRHTLGLVITNNYFIFEKWKTNLLFIVISLPYSKLTPSPVIVTLLLPSQHLGPCPLFYLAWTTQPTTPTCLVPVPWGPLPPS